MQAAHIRYDVADEDDPKTAAEKGCSARMEDFGSTAAEMYGLVRVATISLRFQSAEVDARKMSIDSLLQQTDSALVYQAPDRPCFMTAVVMNSSSLYGDLVIAQLDPTP